MALRPPNTRDAPAAERRAEATELILIRDVGDPPETQPIRLFTKQSVRALLALAAIVVLLLLFIAAFIAANWGNWANTKEFLQWAAPIVTLLLGAAVGYYFGDQRRSY
jgi:uncharacterized integral membrane protein